MRASYQPYASCACCISAPSSQCQETLDRMLAHLPLGRYGYMTNSRVKLITVLDDEEVKDSEMRAVRAWPWRSCQRLPAKSV